MWGHTRVQQKKLSERLLCSGHSSEAVPVPGPSPASDRAWVSIALSSLHAGRKSLLVAPEGIPEFRRQLEEESGCSLPAVYPHPLPRTLSRSLHPIAVPWLLSLLQSNPFPFSPQSPEEAPANLIYTRV